MKWSISGQLLEKLRRQEMQISGKGYNIRAVTETKDLYASIDKDIDILEGQIRKQKTNRNWWFSICLRAEIRVIPYSEYTD